MENKNSYFFLDLRIPNSKLKNETYKDRLTDSVDLVLASMGVNDEVDQYVRNTNDRIIYFFKTHKRKRRGQLVKFCERYLPEEQRFIAKGITRLNSIELKVKLNQHKEYKDKAKKESTYKGEDIKILDERKNWKPWQLTMFNAFFNDNYSFKKPREREIYSIVDLKGRSGKSIFYKWLMVNIGEDEIGKVTFGTASQLRSSVIQMGEKKLYLLDLSRSKGKADSEEDLMAVLENIADGMVSSPMYGKAASLLMEPPHIMITSNYLLDYGLLSMDRWRVYILQDDNSLGPVNQIFKDKEYREKILLEQEKMQQKRKILKSLKKEQKSF